MALDWDAKNIHVFKNTERCEMLVIQNLLPWCSLRYDRPRCPHTSDVGGATRATKVQNVAAPVVKVARLLSFMLHLASAAGDPARTFVRPPLSGHLRHFAREDWGECIF